MNLVRSRAWGQLKPPPGSKIDWGHPLSSGLLAAVVGEQESVSGLTGAKTNVFSRAHRAGGEGIYVPGGASDKIEWSLPNYAISATQPFTLAARVSLTNAPSLSQLFGITSQLPAAVNGVNRAVLMFNGHWYFWGGTSDWDSGIAFDTTGTPRDVVFTGDGSATANMALYVDGVLKASGAAAGAFNTAATFLTVGSHHSSGTAAPTGALHRGAFWKRKLSSSEIAWLAAEPFAFYSPPGPKVLYLPLYVAPTTTSISDGDTGSGTDAANVAASVLDAETGTATDAGESIGAALVDGDTATAFDDMTITVLLADGDTATAADLVVVDNGIRRNITWKVTDAPCAWRAGDVDTAWEAADVPTAWKAGDA